VPSSNEIHTAAAHIDIDALMLEPEVGRSDRIVAANHQAGHTQINQSNRVERDFDTRPYL
jgi:hypothetical protein